MQMTAMSEGSLHKYFKDDFQSVLCSHSALMFINIITAHSIECESMLFVTNHTLHL